MRKFSQLAKLPPTFALAFAFFAVLNLNAQTQPTSNADSKPDTEVLVKQETLDLANKALDELELQDKLIAAQEAENKAVTDRLETEKQRSQLLTELAEARKRQAEFLTTANAAATEALTNKDRIITNKDKEIELLKKKKPSVFKILQYVAVGVAIGFIVK